MWGCATGIFHLKPRLLRLGQLRSGKLQRRRSLRILPKGGLKTLQFIGKAANVQKPSQEFEKDIGNPTKQNGSADQNKIGAPIEEIILPQDSTYTCGEPEEEVCSGSTRLSLSCEFPRSDSGNGEPEEESSLEAADDLQEEEHVDEQDLKEMKALEQEEGEEEDSKDEEEDVLEEEEENEAENEEHAELAKAESEEENAEYEEEAPVIEHSLEEPTNPQVESPVMEYSLEELTNPRVWQKLGIEPATRERSLDDATFQELFGMEKQAFAKIPKWKQDTMKKNVGLF